jgi:hypothetical protein
MATPDTDPQPYRRSQRRRALIGWIGGLLGVAALVVLIVASGGNEDKPRREPFKVPYAEMMTSADYEGIEDGELDAEVLPRLDGSGRPERFTKPYVLILFPPREEDSYCTYWEFSDEPRIFARLCFDKSSGELTQKLKHDVLRPPGRPGGRGTIV